MWNVGSNACDRQLGCTTMADLAEDLRTYFDELARRAEAHAASPVASPPPNGQRSGRRALTLAAALVVLVAAGIALFLLHPPGSPSVEVRSTTAPKAESRWHLTVTPSDHLADGQRVHIHATGFNPHQMTSIATCDARNLEPGVGDAACDAPTSAPANPDGVLDTTYLVRRIIRVNGDAFDCGREPRGCDLAISPAQQPNPGVEHVGRRIQFAPGPAEPLPALSLTPNTGFRDGQTITVTGTNFPANASIWVAECPPTDCGYQAFGVLTQSDRNGSFHQQLTLHRTFTIPSSDGPPHVFDCITGCTILGHANPPAAQLSTDLPFTMSRS